MLALVIVAVLLLWAAAFVAGFYRGCAAAERQNRDDWRGSR